jgi:hypothetical protein
MMASRNKVLRPTRSPSLPHIGVVTVEANMYAVTTQDRWAAPPRSRTMVGSAVDTMVWSKEASSIASISPLKIDQMRLDGSSASRPCDTAWRSLTTRSR